jgi:glycosyltransferase involved in cell wall biosynthesis
MVFHGLSMFLSSIKTVKGLHSNYPFDIIDGHYIYPDGLAAIWLGKLFRKPVVLSARGSDINQFVRFRSIRPMLQYALGKADHVISVCDALKEEMVHLGIRREKITVVPNGIDLDGFKPDDRSIARNKVGLREDGKILLSVGSLTPRKGIHFTLEGLPLILHQHNDLEFYVIGEGPYRKNLERLTRKLNLEGRVHLVGERPHSELSSWYSAADIVCLASSREGWANVIMESLACGTPVVATNVWGAPEIITSKDVGMLVRQSPEAIAHGVIEALSRNWDRDKIRIHVMGRTWENVAGEVRKVFTSIVN